MREEDIYDFGMPEFTQQDLLEGMILDALDNFNTDEAQTLLDQYEELFGQNEFWHLSSIDLAETSNNPDAMMEKLHDAYESQVDADELNLRFGRFFYMVGKPEESLSHLETCEFDPDSEQEFYRIHLMAYCYIIQEDYKKALDCLEDLLLDINDTRVILLAALCYQKTGREERAREYLSQALAHTSDLQEDAASVLKLYNYDENLILKNSSAVLQKLAGVRAAAEDPEMTELLDFLMQIQDFAEVPETFMERVDSYFKDNEDNPMLCCIEGDYYLQIGDEQKARRLFRKALNAPYSGDSRRDLIGVVYRLNALDCLGYSGKTLGKYLHKFLETFPDSAFVRGRLLAFAASKGMKRELAWLLALPEPKADNRADEVSYLENRGRAYFELQEYQKSLELLKQIWNDCQEDEEYLLLMSLLGRCLPDDNLLETASSKLMPHGLAAITLMEYYAERGMNGKYFEVYEQMLKAIDKADVHIPALDAFLDYTSGLNRDEKEPDEKEPENR